MMAPSTVSTWIERVVPAKDVRKESRIDMVVMIISGEKWKWKRCLVASVSIRLEDC